MTAVTLGVKYAVSKYPERNALPGPLSKLAFLFNEAVDCLNNADWIGDLEYTEHTFRLHRMAMGCEWGYYEDSTCMGFSEK